MRILGIETSCDDTAAAVVEVHEEGNSPSFSVLSNVAASQVKAHNKTGGVVPEVAARAHQEKMLEVLQEALGSLGMESMDAIAVTYGPGLLTSLMVGAETAKTLSYITGKPLIGVNHMAGHVYANWLSAQECTSASAELGSPRFAETGLAPLESLAQAGALRPTSDKSSCALAHSFAPQFPILALLVSGGHTELVLMKGHLDFEVIGKTRDDAAGECFDKVAKMLGLGYPGGPEVAKIADMVRQAHHDKNNVTLSMSKGDIISLPRPMLESKDYDFSFSGLKTAVMYWLKEHQKDLNAPALCHEVQNAIVEVLVAKTIRAAKEYNVATVMLGGGVAANNHLRSELGKALSSYLPSIIYNPPPKSYTTDNAAMIAAAGYFYARANKFVSWKELRVDAKLSL